MAGLLARLLKVCQEFSYFLIFLRGLGHSILMRKTTYFQEILEQSTVTIFQFSIFYTRLGQTVIYISYLYP